MRLRDPEPGAASDGDRKPVAVVQRGGPDISAQVPFYPVTNDAFGTASYDQFHDGYFLSRDGMRWFWDQYTTD